MICYNKSIIIKKRGKKEDLKIIVDVTKPPYCADNTEENNVGISADI